MKHICEKTFVSILDIPKHNAKIIFQKMSLKVHYKQHFLNPTKKKKITGETLVKSDSTHTGKLKKRANGKRSDINKLHLFHRF